MPVDVDIIIVILTLIECLTATEVCVKTTCLRTAVSVAAAIACAHLVVPFPFCQIGSATCLEITERAAFDVDVGTCLTCRMGDDVDGSYK